MMCGRARRSRKKTVRRDRSSRSVSRSRTGWGGSDAMREHTVGVGARIDVGDEEQVRAHLRRVRDPVRGEVAEAARRASLGDRREPREKRGRGGETAGARSDRPGGRGVVGARPRRVAEPHASSDRGGKQQRGEREEEPAAGRFVATAAARRRVRRRWVAVAAAEPRPGRGRDVEVAAHLHGVPDVVGDEALQRRRRAALEDERDPEDDRDERGREAPQCDHDQMRDREDQPEEDGRPRALEVVRDDDADRQRGAVARVRRHGVDRRVGHGHIIPDGAVDRCV